MCPNLNKQMNKTIKCSILVLTQNKNDFTSVQFDGENNIKNFSVSNKVVSYFGFFEKFKPTDNIVSTSLTGNFLLLNTEFKFDTNLVGFEIYAVNPGLLTLYVNKHYITN